MNALRLLVAAGVAALLAGPVSAQEAAGPAAREPWSFSASAFAYFVPEDSDYVSPVFAADRERLHLEARYNYEGRGAYSVWAGYNQSAGDKVTLEATWMLGGVFGDVRGIAPGCELTVAYKKLEFYTEGEYLFDTNDSSGNFLYFWSELSYSPADWLRVGLASQRTRAYETELDVQRGVLIGFSRKSWSLSTYVFNLGWTDPTYVVSLGVEF